jgi:membrane protease YdiL (CAAX protease family)
VIQFAFPVLYLALVDPHRLRPSRPNFGGLALGLAFGLAVAGAILLLYFGVLRDILIEMGLRHQVRAKLEEFGAATPGRFLTFAVFISVAHSLLEEYYWRWFVFGRLRTLLALWPAIVVSSVGFMAHHVIVLHVYFPHNFLTAVLPFSLGVAVGGAVWAWLYARSGSLYSPWLSHLLIDAALMGLGYDLIR